MSPNNFPKIQSWSGEAYNFENKLIYDVYSAVEMIEANPEAFQFAMIHFSTFSEQLAARGNIDQTRIDTMSNIDSIRPVLVAKVDNVAVRLIDGYHRAIKCQRAGAEGVAAWVLSRQQTQLIERPFVGQTADIKVVT